MDQKPKTARRTRTYQSARASQAARAAKTAADANADRISKPRKSSSASPSGKSGKKSSAAAAGRTDYSSGRKSSASSGKGKTARTSSPAKSSASSGKKRSYQVSSSQRNSVSSGKKRPVKVSSGSRRNVSASENRHKNRTNQSGFLSSVQRFFLIVGKAIAFFAGEALRLIRGFFGKIASFFLALRGRTQDFLTPGVLIPGILKWAAFAALAVFLFQSLRKTPVSDTPFDTMSKAVTEAADLSNTVQGDNQIIKRLYGLSPSDFNGALLYCPVTNMGAEELLLVRLANPSQEHVVMDAIARRLETQLSNFNGYGVDQTETLENSISLSEGGYCLFYSGNGTQEVQSALKSAL